MSWVGRLQQFTVYIEILMNHKYMYQYLSGVQHVYRDLYMNNEKYLTFIKTYTG